MMITRGCKNSPDFSMCVVIIYVYGYYLCVWLLFMCVVIIYVCGYYLCVWLLFMCVVIIYVCGYYTEKKQVL